MVESKDHDLPDTHLEALPDDGNDFADEHEDTTLAGESEGGPEGAPETESPRGRSGMDD